MSTPETQSFNREVVEFLRPRVGVVDLANPAVYAVHGCSWEAVAHLLTLGNFRGTISDTQTITPYKAGDISTYANPLHPFMDNVFTQSAYPVDQIIRAAETYAGFSSKVHALVVSLGYGLEDPSVQAIYEFGQIPDPSQADAQSLANRLGLPLERVLQAVSTASSRRGFLIGFRQPSPSDNITLSRGEDGGEIILRPANGQRVNYNLIEVIQPLGSFEEAKLDEALRS